MAECLKGYMCAIFDRAGDIDNNIDLRRTCQEHRVLGCDLPAARCAIEYVLRLGDDYAIAACIFEHIDGTLRTPIRDRDNAHAWGTMDNLVGQTLAHETGADDANTNGI